MTLPTSRRHRIVPLFVLYVLASLFFLLIRRRTTVFPLFFFFRSTFLAKSFRDRHLFLLCWPLASYCITTGRPSSRRPGPGCAPTPPCASPQQASATAALYEQSRPAAQPSALTYTDRCGPYSGAAADRLPGLTDCLDKPPFPCRGQVLSRSGLFFHRARAPSAWSRWLCSVRADQGRRWSNLQTGSKICAVFSF